MLGQICTLCALLMLTSIGVRSSYATVDERVSEPVALLLMRPLRLANNHAPFEASVEPADSASDDGLGPSTDPPWNPSKPASSRETWETVVQFPSRLALFPISALRLMMKRGLVVVEETHVVPRVLYLISLQERVGLYLFPASLGDRTGLGGTIRYSPGYAHELLNIELSGSTSAYNRTLVQLGPSAIRSQYQLDWRPREQFFGTGPHSLETDESTYAARSERLELISEHVERWASVRAWVGARDLVLHRGRDPENPSFHETFTGLGNQLLDQRVSHAVYGIEIIHDARSGIPHWNRGVRARIKAERFDRPFADLALRDPNTPARSFTRWTYEAEAGFSFYRDPRTIRLSLKAVDLQLSEGGGLILLPELSVLGGNKGLAGFEPGRFQDLDLLIGKLSYIFPLAKHLELELHGEWGAVSRDWVNELGLSRLEKSFGVGLRPRLETAPLGSLGLDWSRETVRLRFSVGGVE